MRIGFSSGLFPQIILVILLIIIIAFVPSNILRIILGIPLVLLFPGYSLILALFPRKDQLSNTQRVALSFGLSIAVVPLIGLILNYTPWGITLESTLYSITVFILVTSAIAWLRLNRLDEVDRFTIDLKIKEFKLTGSRWDKALSVIMVASMLATICVLVYVLATPKVGEKFTEFYILGQEGEAAGYPTEISVGDEATVILGIVNHEQEQASYRVEIVVDGIEYDEIDTITLENDEKWENIVTFSADRLGDDQRVDFVLFKNGQSEAYNSLHLWIDVR